MIRDNRSDSDMSSTKGHDCDQDRAEEQGVYHGHVHTGVSRALTRQEQLELMADNGIDTWEDYRMEK